MSYVDENLLNEANKMGNFIKLQLHESFKGIYLGYDKVFSDKFKKDTFKFKFEVEGAEKSLSSSSAKVVRKFAYIKKNTAVKVTKIDEGNKTDYSVEEVSGKKLKKKKSLVSKKKKKLKKKKKKSSLSL